jgi:hypothetical protein
MESFQHFTLSFDIHISQMSLCLQSFQTKIEGCEHALKKHFNQQQKRFTELTETHLETFEDRLTIKMEETIQQRIQHFDESIQNHISTILTEKSKSFENQLSNIADEMLQDVYNAAEDGHKALSKAVGDQLQEFRATIAAEKANMSIAATYNTSDTNKPPIVLPAPAQCFAHVRTNPNFCPTPNLYDVPDATISLPGNIHQHASSTLCNQKKITVDTDSVPTTVQTPLPYALPPVNHDQALKHVRIHFTGLGDIFVFYNQLMNALEQFGIYLIPLSNVKYQQSLCPRHHRGTPLDSCYRQRMASTLYQKLQSTDIIPMEYTSIRNIVNRFAEANNGYKVLYAMLELVHPALQTDVVMLPPKSKDCDDDIHLYAQKFDAWHRYETYANRPYSPREQVNKFIDELSPTFAPAISQVRRLLGACNPFDITVPEVLKITAFLNTIECFMSEELGHHPPHIQKIVAADRKFQSALQAKLEGRNTEQPESMDIYCHFCGEYGHPPCKCHFMVKLMKARASLDKVDSKMKKEALESFRQKKTSKTGEEA